MKKHIAFFLVPISVLMLLSSCSMEKRLYRNGWYSEHSKQIVQVSNDKKETSTGDFTNEKTVAPDSVAKTKSNSSDSFSLQKNSRSEKIAKFVNTPIDKLISKITKNTTEKSNQPARMTYTQARKQMADKGCKPNTLAIATYYLAWASVITCLFGIGILLCLATLIFAIFATNDVTKKGNCVDENLAIINNAKRICYVLLIVMAILSVIALLLLLALFAFIGFD